MGTSQAELAARFKRFCQRLVTDAAQHSALITQSFGWEDEAHFWMRLVSSDAEVYRIYTSKRLRFHLLVDCTNKVEYTVLGRHRVSGQRPLNVNVLEKVETSLPFPREVAWGVKEYGFITELLYFPKGTICLPEAERDTLPPVRLVTTRQQAAQSLCSQAIRGDGTINLEVFWELVRDGAIVPLVTTLARATFFEYDASGIYVINDELLMHPYAWKKHPRLTIRDLAVTRLRSVELPRVSLPGTD